MLGGSFKCKTNLKKTDKMQKEELIHLHSLMAELKDYVDEKEDEIDADFEEYQTLETSPVHVHRSKSEHKHAIFVLGEELNESVGKEPSKEAKPETELR